MAGGLKVPAVKCSLPYRLKILFINKISTTNSWRKFAELNVIQKFL
jgi:hypothetical protein